VDGKVYFGANDGIFYCLDEVTGKPCWIYEAGEKEERAFKFFSEPSVENNRVFVGAANKMLYCLDAETGKLLFKYRTNDWIRSRPICSGDRVYAASLDGLITMLSGMSSFEQLEDNMKTVKNLKVLNSREMNAINKAIEVLRNTPRVPCTGCRYCVENCPQKINIPDLMDIYSDYLVYNTTANSDFPFFLATKDGGKPSSCLSCRVCESHCPQHIEISQVLAKMAPLYEK
jgi:ferredoxin